jgi:hypothetical protein
VDGDFAFTYNHRLFWHLVPNLNTSIPVRSPQNAGGRFNKLVVSRYGVKGDAKVRPMAERKDEQQEPPPAVLGKVRQCPTVEQRLPMEERKIAAVLFWNKVWAVVSCAVYQSSAFREMRWRVCEKREKKTLCCVRGACWAGAQWATNRRRLTGLEFSTISLVWNPKSIILNHEFHVGFASVRLYFVRGVRIAQIFFLDSAVLLRCVPREKARERP